MQPLAFYLLKVIACSGILLLYYRLALRNKRFHYYNRFYLLMSMAASLLLPLLKFNWFTVESSSKAITMLGAINIQGGEEVYINQQHGFSFASINWQLLSVVVYVGVSLLLLAVLIWRIIKIYCLKKKYGAVNMAEFDFVNTDIAQAPFSFLHNLFWREDIDMNEATGRQVLLHELTHIRQKHTWDKLWMQIITAMLWINPFYWFIQKELYMLHEFIADEKAIENNDGAAFAAMLLTSQYGKNIFSPAQQFSYSPIKRRLFMLTNLTKPRYSYARRLMVLPLLATVVLLFAFKLQKKDTITPQTHTSSPIKIIIDAGHGGSDDGAVVDGVNEKDITLKIANKIKDLSATYGIKVLLTRNGDYTVDNKERITFAAGEKVAAFISIHTDYVAPNIKPGNTKQQQGIEAFVTKQNAHYAQSTLLGSAVLQSLSNNFKVSRTLTEREQPAYILSHNNLPALLLECGWMNNTSDLKQMTDEAAIELMARKILEGVVAFANSNNTKATLSFRDSSGVVVPVPMPLFVLNGKIVNKAAIDTLDQNNIESMDVLKNKTTTAKYGHKAANGVIEVVTKNASLSNPHTTIQSKDTSDVAINNNFDKNNLSDLKPEPLYVVNGKIFINTQQLAIINPADIESLVVLKDKAATVKYGTKGSNGIVEIWLKNVGFTASGAVKGTSTTDGTAYITANKVTINGTGNIYQASYKDSIQAATFPGGPDAWINYLSKQLRADVPAKNGAPAGVYTAIVVFTVDVNGNLSQVKAEKDPGYGTGAEAVRVIQRGPKWIPAKQNGEPVTFTQKQAVSFKVSK